MTRRSPARVLVAGFSVLIAVGTVLLMLPAATTGGIGFVDALFTATSSVCVTGLIVKSTPMAFTVFGKTVILVLIQIGGLGYMSMATLMGLLMGRKIGISERVLIKESLNISSIDGIVVFMKHLFMFVFAVELIGAIALTIRFMHDFPFDQALAQGVFHSVSAFNNAGFSLFSDSLMRYRGDLSVNVIISALVVSGGIGFIAALEVLRPGPPGGRRFSQHTLVALSTTAVLLVGGALLVYVSEINGYFPQQGMGAFDSALASCFASVTARTAGFNTMDYVSLAPATVFLTIGLMLVGASPGGTGGGLKTTTFAIINMHLWSTVRGRRDTVLFKRRVPEEHIAKALVILSLSLAYVAVVTFVVIEHEGTGFAETLFEVASAFATVGLSMGNGGDLSLAADFSSTSKILIVFTMLVGRLGPLTVFSAMLLRGRPQTYRYPEGRIMIG